MAASCLVVVWVLVGLVNWFLVRSAADTAEGVARNTAVMAAAYVKQSLDAGNLVLHGMQALLVEKGVQGEAAYRAFLDGPAATQALRDRIANMKEVDKASFVDRTGEILSFSVVYPPPPINVADRDYFREQMGRDPPDRSLSAAVLDRSSGRWTFFLAQRVVGGVSRAALLAQEVGPADGAPFGLAIVGIRASLLSDFLGQNRLGDAAAVLLLRDDDVLLAGAGVPPTAYGQRFPFGPATGRGPGVGQRSATDIVAAEPVGGFPARVVVLGAPVEDPKARRWLAATLALGAAVSAAVLFALRQTLRALAACTFLPKA